MPLIDGKYYPLKGKDEYKDCIRYCNGLCTFNDMQCNPEGCQFLQDWLRNEFENSRDN